MLLFFLCFLALMFLRCVASCLCGSSQQVQTPRTGGGGNHIAALFGSVKERLWDVSQALNKSGPAYGSNGDLLPTSTPQQASVFFSGY